MNTISATKSAAFLIRTISPLQRTSGAPCCFLVIQKRGSCHCSFAQRIRCQTPVLADHPRAGLHRPGIHPACRPTTHVVPPRQACCIAIFSIIKAFCAQATFSCACRDETTTTHPRRPQAGHAGPAQPDALSAPFRFPCSPPGAVAKQQCHTSVAKLCPFGISCSVSVRVPLFH